MPPDNEATKDRPFYQEVDGYRIPGFFPAENFKSALQYKPIPEDIFIATYPKCGTTWIQNIVSSIIRGGKPFTSLEEFLNKSPFLEMTGADAAKNLKRPSPIKVHFPFNLVPYSPEAKYIFLARNPKDCCVSFYYHTKNYPPYLFSDGSFEEYFELFINGKTDWGDYFDTVMSWYEHRNDPNVLFLTYEDLKKDTEGNILKISEFLGDKYKDVLMSNPKVVTDIVQQSSFKDMKETFDKFHEELATKPKECFDFAPVVKELLQKKAKASLKKDVLHFRKGIIGDWRTHFSAEQNARLEAKFKERTKGTDLPRLWEECM